jgi:cytochrome bd ubiquinol oxidase subunit I
VQGLMKTVNANSPSVSSTDIWISLITFVLIYIALGAADLFLMLRYARKGLGSEEPTGPGASSDATSVPALTY